MGHAQLLARCRHCNLPLVAGQQGPFCCSGCRVVHELLLAGDLERFYELRGAEGVPVRGLGPTRRDDKWLEAIEARRAEAGAIARVDLDVQGIHCTACVWLIESLFQRCPGARSVLVNPARGQLQLLVTPEFPLAEFLRALEPFGYLCAPPGKAPPARSSDLVIRMGVCIALAMNAMIFAIAGYAGLVAGPTHTLLSRWNLAVSTLSVLVGGTVFFRSAWQGARRGVLHLDLPVAIGIALSFAGSLYGYFFGHQDGIYIDTVDIFIALMLVGRFLQERVLEANRRALLADDGADGILVRRARDGRVETVPARSLELGDRLLLAPGDVVPTRARLEEAAELSLDWIDGESTPRRFERDAVVPAGAFLASDAAVTAITVESFADSRLVSLLRTPAPRREEAAMSAPFWRRLAEVYVSAVLVLAVIGFVGWLLATGDVARSVGVATALLVGTCPCAFGIATPLAYDLAQAGLRRAGLHVRSAGFLDRAARVRQVVFDKTGTLTTGELRVARPEELDALRPAERALLASIASSSRHPKSVAIERALAARGELVAPVSGVHEVAGRGLSLQQGEREYRLGRSDWSTDEAVVVDDVTFSVGGRRVARIELEEDLRPGAAADVAALRADGTEVWLLSGDSPARVAQTARLAGIDDDHAIGGCDPDEKAVWLAAHDREDLLMMGDGLNDALVVARAFCSGTPAIDRPFMAARSDFYLVTPGLSAIRLALRTARRLVTVRRRNVRIAVAYNVLTVSLALTGHLSPVVCALLMPASSLVSIASSVLSLSVRSRLWKS